MSHPEPPEPVSVYTGDIVEATFTPVRTDDLTPEAQRIVGQRFRFTATHITDDGFPYAGQWRMELDREQWEATGVFHVPLCDLSDLVLVGVDSYYADLDRVLHRERMP